MFSVIISIVSSLFSQCVCSYYKQYDVRGCLDVRYYAQYSSLLSFSLIWCVILNERMDVFFK
jgi:hypothetical protein